jgi:hypothetical protein
MDPIVAYRLLERLGHMLLADDLGEGLGAIPAIEGERHRTTLTLNADTDP